MLLLRAFTTQSPASYSVRCLGDVGGDPASALRLGTKCFAFSHRACLDPQLRVKFDSSKSIKMLWDGSALPIATHLSRPCCNCEGLAIRRLVRSELL